MRRSTKCVASSAAVALLVSLSACGTDIRVETPGQASGPMVTIGVPADEPGMSWYHDGSYAGFSIDVATQVAKTMGYSSKQIVFRSVEAGQRGQMLADGQVDMVLGTYPRPTDGKAVVVDDVAYTDPYLVTGEAALMRAGEERPDTLKGQVACVTEGSVAARTLAEDASGVKLERRSSFQQCMSSLLAGVSDVVAAPEPVALGLRQQTGDHYVDVVDESWHQVAFGIGVRPDQTTLVDSLNSAIALMVKDGSWQDGIDALHAQVGFDADMSANPPVQP